MATTGDTLGIGVSALLASQRGLATTGHNIANVNTEGYSRQRVELGTRTPYAMGSLFIGQGVDVNAIRRSYDDFLTGQVRTATSADGDLKQYVQLASQIDDLLADPSTGLNAGLQQFFDAVQGVANDPASTSARQVMLSEGNALIGRFQFLDRQFESLRQGVNTTIRNSVADINGLANSIAQLNREIVRAQGATGGSPNDLLDQRDAQIAKLSEQVSVTTVAQEDGALNVFIGNGQALVMSGTASALTTINDPFDATRLEVGFGAGGSVAVVSSNLNGGVLGGALRFRGDLLDRGQNAVGRIATGLGMTMNAQQREGMTLNGALGANLFTVGTPDVVARISNTGAGAVTATISNAAALSTSDYRVTFNGGGSWSVTRLSDGAVTTGAGPFNIDGLTITVGGAAATGDSFLVQPTRDGATDIALAISDTRLIAAAAPIRASAASANASNASISAGEVLDVTNPNLLTATTLNFVSATQYQVNGAGPLIAYTSGANIDMNGWRVQVSGTPAADDVFTIGSNAGGVSDNRNALLLADLQNQLTLDNSSTSFVGAYGQLVTDVGTTARAASASQKAQENLLKQVTESRDATSAVNLDEEAANLLRYQQAYQAAAQIIATSDTLFQSLLAAVRG
jgi:flagellar hook-associated protein 1